MVFVIEPSCIVGFSVFFIKKKKIEPTLIIAGPVEKYTLVMVYDQKGYEKSKIYFFSNRMVLCAAVLRQI